MTVGHRFAPWSAKLLSGSYSIHHHHYNHHRVGLKRKEPREEREELECFISYLCSFYFPTSGYLNRKRYTAKFLCSFQVLFDFIFYYCIWRNASETEKHMIYKSTESILFVYSTSPLCLSIEQQTPMSA